jgi:hypothetical protein
VREGITQLAQHTQAAFDLIVDQPKAMGESNLGAK